MKPNDLSLQEATRDKLGSFVVHIDPHIDPHTDPHIYIILFSGIYFAKVIYRPSRSSSFFLPPVLVIPVWAIPVWVVPMIV